MKLTHKQRMFADEHLKSGNATEATLKAGYSKKTSYSIGNENLKSNHIFQNVVKKSNHIKLRMLKKLWNSIHL